MTWGEIQVESLKKMFLSSEILSVEKLELYKKDKKFMTYLDAMPHTCNEAIDYIIERTSPIIKEHNLEKLLDGKYDLKEIIKDFKKIVKIVFNNNQEYQLMPNNTLIINNQNWLNCSIYYEAYHNPIKQNTSEETQLEIEPNLARLIPLYIAGELYKDDDISLATMYMNEFENKLANIIEKTTDMQPNSIVSIYSM